jgi:hypothetical protein
MLASSAVRAAGERVGGAWLTAAAAGGIAFCALFFANGSDLAPLVWIGGLALALAALTAAAALLGLAAAPRLTGPAGVFVGCLFGLVVWMGASTRWSLSPDGSWTFTNRTLVYAAFALAGVLLGARLSRPGSVAADGGAVLLALVFGWALLAKCVPALYADYGRLARLRAPLGYWNELALLGAVAVPLALRLAAPRGRAAATRAAGALLLYAAVLVTLLTYSRVGIALAVLAAAAWVLLDGDRIESLAAAVLAGGAGAAAFGVALALPGISQDGQPRAVRAHDGWVFALAVVALGVLVAGVALALAALEGRRPLPPETRRRAERVAGVAALVAVLAGLAVGAAFAPRIWREFTNPVSSQVGEGVGRLSSANSSNRWRWWVEEWHAFTGHPFLGTGAGTFELTDRMQRRSPIVTTEPHNTPLQFLGETGIVGFLLYAGAVAAAAVGIVRARRLARGAERAAVTAVGIALGVFLLHMVVDTDWSYVATCGPLLLATGLLLGRPAAPAPARRRLLTAAAAVLVALAGLYSLAAPWLAQRALAGVPTIARAKAAHAYDPLSIYALSDWAALEDGSGNVLRALQLYQDEVALEPKNAATWYDLGAFYYGHGAWQKAYEALSRSWTYDRFGPAGTPCGLLDQARHKALGVWPPSCPRGSPRAATP